MKRIRVFAFVFFIVSPLTIPVIFAQIEINHKMGISLSTDIFPKYFADMDVVTFFSTGISYQVEKNRFWCNIGVGYEQQYNHQVLYYNDVKSFLFVAHAVVFPINLGGNFYAKNKLTISAFGGLKVYYCFIETTLSPQGKTANYPLPFSNYTNRGIGLLVGGIKFLYAFSSRFSLAISTQSSTLFFGFSTISKNKLDVDDNFIAIPFFTQIIGLRIDMLFNLKNRLINKI